MLGVKHENHHVLAGRFGYSSNSGERDPMLIRFWHFLFGHKWRERDIVYCGPWVASSYLYGEKAIREKHGFTDITMLCECGAIKEYRLTGRHTPEGDPEVNALRHMAGLN